jgi:hypothetical protein
VKTIYKYTLAHVPQQDLPMPKDAEILSAQMQGRHICIWAMVEPQNDPAPRTIAVYGTGMFIEGEPGKHIATIQDNGSFVWHVYERITNRKDDAS